ncbi:probable vacuolar amino acid transporter YPQ1 isoform X1 [Amborella trichopoda]|uniref:probable vacuolar amino acid transporter YPQ1 isoform X1 n=1 Tax=Amborella trichopoda TaxID=13333 RepID=UPI0009BEAF6D|nr:probable vacuolar amino acid transporter YPQ1 isoform X1 [Amborella trichopoda]|eukprot:XP_020530369.1 probable vacuolar amino acid transporter YPQ1 isoform X1 [Amborella trichopoda]
MKKNTASSRSCSPQKECVSWVLKYFGDCLCNSRDSISFAFGLVSLVCWGVAEVPQIVTNCSTKATDGVSLAFLLTWVVGDVFNLVGCLLEPATLPTQFYTALLYTATTIVLVLQTIYYEYFLKWLKHHKIEHHVPSEVEPLNSKGNPPSTPIPMAGARMHDTTSHGMNLYIFSARSLAFTRTPPPHDSFLRVTKSVPPVAPSYSSSSEDDDHERAHAKPASAPKRMLNAVGYGTFIASGLTLPIKGDAVPIPRRLLQEHGESRKVYGMWLGWMMAAIYMGGRLPQIYLNMKRGSVEGLNPLMFVFALIANATYVGRICSILFRSTEWDMIKANMPWLLDAIVCVALDLFIIMQFVYYKFTSRRRIHHEEGDFGAYSKD